MSLRAAPEPGPSHAPVCGVCGERWPCREERIRVRDLRVREDRDGACWACGTDVPVSQWMFTVIGPGGVPRFSAWCGPGNARRHCHEIGELYLAADQRCRQIRGLPSASPTAR